MGNKYEGKKILVLGGTPTHVKLVETCKSMGIYTIVADQNPQSPAALVADEVVSISLLDAEGIIDYCKENNVDGVLNCKVDVAQNTYEKVCREICLPCYAPTRTFDLLTDKRLFKESCQLFGLDIIPSYSENDPNIEFPVMVKPAESGGGIGMTICQNHDELSIANEKAKKRSRNGCFFIEKYMGNHQELHVLYYVIAGEPCLIRINDRYTGNVEDGLNRQCICALQPSKYTAFYIKHFDTKMKDFIRNVGVENGPVSFQGFVDGDTIRWYDPAVRFPGGNYDAFFKEIHGIDLIEHTIIFALTGRIELSVDDLNDSYNLKGFYAAQLDVDVEPGTITSIEGLEQIKEIPEVVSAILWRQIGDKVEKTGDVRQRLAEIAVFTNKGQDTMVNLIKKIQGLIKAYDENGNNMIISPVNAERLFRL